MAKKKRIRPEVEYLDALYKIAMMGHGMKEDARDWGAIGRNAVMQARSVIAGKCEACGCPKQFKPARSR